MFPKVFVALLLVAANLALPDHLPGSGYYAPQPPPPPPPPPPTGYGYPQPTPATMEHEKGMPFNFNYEVKDAVSSNDFSHKADSDGKVTNGEYRILLADGRTQIVKYVASWKDGYTADVTYEGEAKVEPPKPTPGTYEYPKPTGTYGPPKPISPVKPAPSYAPPKPSY